VSETRDRREYPERPIVGVGAVIVEGGKVLLIRRRYEPLKGQWSLPGGAVEVGEALERAVEREMLEETGLAVDVGPVIEVFDRITRDERASRRLGCRRSNLGGSRAARAVRAHRKGDCRDSAGPYVVARGAAPGAVRRT
jgi:ADP-ribose pyrophosphatase YjhB (NUDIX family)